MNPPSGHSNLSGSQESLPFHSLSANEIAESFHSDRANGLTDEQVEQARRKYGWNQLAEKAAVPWWTKFLAQFKELLVWILIVAALIAGVMGEWIDAIAILVIVVLNGILGFVQEEKASRALAALKAMASPLAKVIRSGEAVSLESRELVPGDLITLEAGDKIPADARLIEAFSSSVDESSLTGESIPVQKDAHSVLDEKTPVADRQNLVFMGTHVTTGKATAIVVATGTDTELGQIAGMLEGHEKEATPLQRRLSELGRVLVVLCLVLITLIFTIRFLGGGELVETLLVAVSLAVAAVPEGLPAVVTISLAIGLQRMVKRNALIRKLASVETLGSVTVICSDKTGTLTRNEMTVREIWLGNEVLVVTGSGYEPEGEFHLSRIGSSDSITRIEPSAQPDVEHLMTIGQICNNSNVVFDRQTGNWVVIGDPTEGALVVLARKAKLHPENIQVVDEIPFDSERKMMSVVVRDGKKTFLYSKGAPEVILRKSTHEKVHGKIVPLSDERRAEIREQNSNMASKALRVLGLASRVLDEQDDPANAENELVFVGMVGMLDPPREEVQRAVQECFRAGIQPVMITGDHPETAHAIGRELKLASTESKVCTGQDLDLLSDSDLVDRVQSITIYARVSAAHKLRVVNAWKAHGEVVAMTGDGVNDAPAIQAADIGVAMGITGTDVTKEAADMVLTDDNFASIVSAVREGRGIFDNIRKFVHYLLSCNAGEVLLMFVATLLGMPLPLVATQILWINLVTDGLPALALALEPTEPGIMDRKPRPMNESVINRQSGLLILYHGSLIAVAALVGFSWVYYQQSENLEVARTAAFAITAFSQLVFAYVCRSQRFPLYKIGLFSNRWLIAAIIVSGLLQLLVLVLPFARPVFDVAIMPSGIWLFSLLMALLPALVIELTLVVRTLTKKQG